jgi:hypothetical protein
MASAAVVEAPPAAAPAAPVADAAPATPAAIELKLPEGFDADAKALTDFKSKAAELGLDSPKAQAIIDQYVALEQSRTKQLEDAFAQQDAKWAAELAALPEFLGTKKDAAMADVHRAIKHFGGHEVAQLLDRAGLGNHPRLVQGFAAIGRALREDSIAGTTAAAAAVQPEPSWADVAYPTMKKSNEKES